MSYDDTEKSWDNDRPQQQQNNNGFAKPSYSVDRSQPRTDYQGGGNSNGYQKPNYPNNSGGQGSNGGYQKRDYGQGGGQRNYGGQGGGTGGQGGGGFRPKPADPNATYYKPYAVTGNDNPPPHVEAMLQRMVRELEEAGYTMRCGGMKGIEQIAEDAARNNKEIHLPWRDFDNKQSKFTYTDPNAPILAAKFHPTYDSLNKAIKTFLAKNVRVLMGKDLKSPALFLITWSEDGVENARHKSVKTGNAGHSISIASHLMIPIFNLGHPDVEEKFRNYISQNKLQETTRQQNDSY